eukprot:6065725-Amphidinium_carterae.1
MAMRCNYLSQDRPDVSFAAKEAARRMSTPNERGLEMTKRIVRYLHKHPRVVQRMVEQRPPEVLDVFSDANYGGCLRTRKSTSCCCVLHGGHMLKLKKTLSVRRNNRLRSARRR